MESILKILNRPQITNLPSIGVVIPLFNQGTYIERCLESVVLNKRTDKYTIDICIVDDASTDNSIELTLNCVTELEASGKLDRINLLFLKHTENKGPSAARNLGIKTLDAVQYIVCLDADDKLADNYLNENLNALLKTPANISYTNSQCFGVSQQLHNFPAHKKGLLKRGNFINCSAMYKRKVWEDVGGYDELMTKGYEDYEFWIRAERHGFVFVKCNTTVLYWYKGPNISRDDIASKNLDEIYSYIKTKHKEWFNEKT